jgi:SUMO ligase MMS21 Smc5/6 complex component
LEVWQKAMDMVTTCYQMTATFPINNLLDKTSEIGRMVNGLRKSIEKKIKC